METHTLTAKMRCTECDWPGETGAEVDVVADPKAGSDTRWMICPKCRAADPFVSACDVPGCWEDVSSGTPTPEGYARRCFRHPVPRENVSAPYGPAPAFRREA